MEWMQFKPDDYEKAEDYWFKMERMFSRMEEKKIDNREWFSVWMMMQMERGKKWRSLKCKS